MANKGGSGYIKRLYAPKYFAINKKSGGRYVVRQDPGRHTMARSVALSLVLIKLEFAKNSAESSRIIKGGTVKINDTTVKESKFPVGFSDIITVGEQSKILGITGKGQLKASDPKDQVYKVLGKYKTKGSRIMLRLHDGRILDGPAQAQVNDSAVMAKGSVSKILKLQEGSKCEVIDGVHVGTTGVIKSIREGNMHKQKSVTVEHGNESFDTIVKNIIVVG